MRPATVAGLVAVALLASDASAVSTRSFLLDSASDLAAGELEGTAVHSNGSVTTGAGLRRIELPEVPVAWSLVRGANGTVFIGTGQEGKIYRLQGDTLEEHAATGQLLVASLAAGPNGVLYAGTLPEGRIYRVGSDGTVRELARPEGAEHVWDLVWDARRRTLFAATGPEGKVFSISPGGETQEYYDSAAGHIMSLALDGDGSLYAGTSDEALVVRLRSAGQADVVHDFPGNEVTAIAARDGVLAVVANEFPDPPNVRTSSSSTSSKGQPPRPKPGKGKLFRVGGDRRVELLFEQDKLHFTSVQIAEGGTIYVGGGKEGRVYRIGPDRTSATWIDVDERQVLDLDFLGGEPVFVTGDAGAVYRVTTGRAAEPVWNSKVLDAKFTARWGHLSWRADGPVSIQTRAGNTEEPDASWSEWSAALTAPGPVRSPSARFVQVRARFAQHPDTVLRAVRLFYLPQNQRPVVTTVRVKAEDKKHDLPKPSTTYTLTWDVDNPDDDSVRYRLQYRAEGQDIWRDILREDEELTKTEYSWETVAVPDGWYVVRVAASDELSNPESLTLRSTADSEPLLIDNHAPSVSALRQRGGTLLGEATDTVGPIARLEHAVDGGEWRMFFPKDHLLDTRTESFEVPLADLSPGTHIVAVRAYDAGGNSASVETTVRVGH